MEINSLNEATLQTVFDIIYPIGSIYISLDSSKPKYGTWETFAEGRTLIGVNSEETEFNKVEKMGGEKEHKLTPEEMPIHNHGSVELEGNFWNFPGQMKEWAGTANGICSMIKHDDKQAYVDNCPTVDAPDCLHINANHAHGFVGGDQPHNNLPPYVTVYMYKRIG